VGGFDWPESDCVQHEGTRVSFEAEWSLYVPPVYSPVVTIFTANLQPSGHYMYRQFNIQQFYVLPTQRILCVLCGSENKQRLFPYTTLTEVF
jgi:hypothetical protein